MFWNKRVEELEKVLKVKLKELIELAETNPVVWNNPNIVEVVFNNPDNQIPTGKIVLRIAGVTGQSLSPKDITTHRFLELVVNSPKGAIAGNISSALGAFSGTDDTIIEKLKQDGALEYLLSKPREKAQMLKETCF